MGSSVGGRLVGWVGGGRFVRGSVLSCVYGAVMVFGTTAVLYSLRCIITCLLWRGSSTKQRIRLLLYCWSMVGWVGWWVHGLVGGWVCRAVCGWCLVGDLEEVAVSVQLLC